MDMKTQLLRALDHLRNAYEYVEFRADNDGEKQAADIHRLIEATENLIREA